MIPTINRDPDFVLPGYLERWHLTQRVDGGSIYLHHFLAPDVPVLHNHPWPFRVQILNGDYEERVAGIHHRGSLAFGDEVELTIAAHDTLCTEGESFVADLEKFHYIKRLIGDVWTLVTTADREGRSWGFINEHGAYEEHHEYTDRTGRHLDVDEG